MINKYDVALSFAGEDRSYVACVAQELRKQKLRVFYDEFEEIELWGKDLYSHLADVYQKYSSVTVMFISEHYVKKVWPNHERKSAQARALTESREYILPAYFSDEIEVPGFFKTTSYISLKAISPQEFASKVVNKLETLVRLKSKSDKVEIYDIHSANKENIYMVESYMRSLIREAMQYIWSEEESSKMLHPALMSPVRTYLITDTDICEYFRNLQDFSTVFDWVYIHLNTYQD